VSSYVFDHALELEQERLGKLSEWLDPGTSRYFDQVGAGPGWRVLEVGAGAGSIVRELSDRVGPSGSVLATDLDLKFLETLDLPNVEVQRHDIANDPLPEDFFDLVHVRLVLMHLTPRVDALKKMVAAAKPGGYVVVEDMEFLTWVDVTPSEPMTRVKAAMEKLFALAGADPTLGRQLPILMEAAGLTDVWLEGRVAWGHRWENPGLQMFKLMLMEMRDFLAQTGAVTGEDVDAAIATIDDPAWLGMPPMIVTAIGRKPSVPATGSP
jgi:SAM-dependent methyltransferase